MIILQNNNRGVVMRPRIGHAVQTELSMRHCMAVWFTFIYDTIASGSQTSCSETLRGILDKSSGT